MDFKYVRIQGREVASNTHYAAGPFSMCRKLIQQTVMDPEDEALFKELEAWFVENLPFPEPCMRKEKVVCFFKVCDDGTMMKMITPMLWLLERYNHPFYVVYTNTPGEIVYEDEFQVAVRVPEMPVVEFHHEWIDPDDAMKLG